MPKYSFIIPVYNRPTEVEELLDSLNAQSNTNFEVVVVEDGSAVDCQVIVKTYSSSLNISYHRIPNSGPGAARNFGASQASGDWFIFLDSDTLVPTDYLNHVEKFLDQNDVAAFGGADQDREDFLPIQKAISYSMTSILTTGGIRGNSHSMEKFKPRSFNMGIKKDVFEKLGGFGTMRYGEDIDFSLRIERANYKTAFIPTAFVYHKRRTSFKSFFKQIRHSGEARVLLSKLHKGSFKMVHLFPGLFTLGLLLSIALYFSFPVTGIYLMSIYVAYFVVIWVHSSLHTRSIKVGFLAIIASFVQLSAYGYGFFKASIFYLKKD